MKNNFNMENLCYFLLFFLTSPPVLAQFEFDLTHNCKPDQVIINNLITKEYKCAKVCPEIFADQDSTCICNNNKQCEHLTGAKCERTGIENSKDIRTCRCTKESEVVNDDLSKCLKRVGLGEECETNEQCNYLGKEAFCSAHSDTCCEEIDKELCVPRVEIDGKCHNDNNCMHRGAVCSDQGDTSFKCRCDSESSVQIRKGVRTMCECIDGFIKSEGKLWKCLRKAGKLGDVCENSDTSDEGGKICLAKVTPKSEVCTGTDQYGNAWTAPLSSNTTKPCPFGKPYYTAFWHCSENGTFDGKTPDYGNCSSDWVDNVFDKIDGPKELEFQNAHRLLEDIRKNVTEILENSESSADFYGHELSKLLKGMNTTAQKFTPITEADADRNLLLADSVLQSLSNMLKYEKIWHQLPADKMHRTFAQLVEVYSKVPLDVAVKGCQNSNCSFPFRYDNTEIGQNNGATLQLTFPLNEQRTKGKNSFLEIKLPRDKAVLYSASGISANFVSAYSSQELISHGKRDNSLVTNGDLLIFTTRATGSHATDGKEFSGPIDMTLLHGRYSWGNEVQNIRRTLHDGEAPTAVHGSVHCVFWDVNLTAWTSDEGCRVTESSSFSTTCSCSHLSSFTIMMNVHRYIGKSHILMGLTFALIALLLIYLIGKIVLLISNNGESKDGAGVGDEILKYAGIVITVTCYGVVFFLADKHYFLFSNVTCYGIGIFGHFSVMFMVLALTIQFLINFIEYGFIQQFDILLKMPRVVMFLGIPFAVSTITVLITVGVDIIDGYDSRAYGGEFCWLDGTFVYSLFIPMWVLLSCNYYFLAAIFRKANSSDDTVTTLTQEGSSKQVPVNDVIAFFKSGVVTNSVVLTTWLIGFFYLGPQNPLKNESPSEFMSYLFTFLFFVQAVLMDKLYDKKGLIKWIVKKIKGKKGRNDGIPTTEEEMKSLRSKTEQ